MMNNIISPCYHSVYLHVYFSDWIWTLALKWTYILVRDSFWPCMTVNVHDVAKYCRRTLQPWEWLAIRGRVFHVPVTAVNQIAVTSHMDFPCGVSPGAGAVYACAKWVTASIIPGGTKAVCDDCAGTDRDRQANSERENIKIISKLWRFLIAIGDVNHGVDVGYVHF